MQHDPSSHGVRPGGSDTASRIEPPQPPPIDRRGGSALAFGVLRADDDVGPRADTATLRGARASRRWRPTRRGARDRRRRVPGRPDLVLIDGGARPARRRTAGARRNSASATSPLIGVAKGPDRDAGREHFHIPGRDRPMMLEPRDPVLYFVQRLRDEAHRFAIGTHRAKRSKAIGANPLDEIPGIGPARKRALLKHFGSAKAVSRAGRRRPAGGRGHQRADGADHLRFLPRAAGLSNQSAQTRDHLPGLRH